MAHLHSLYDTDPHFKIDGETRMVTNVSEVTGKVVQYDHNSERLTFELPRYIDGHDMSACNSVHVHYINLDPANKKHKNTGVYEVDDLQTSPNGEEVTICSWLVSGNATKYAGPLAFVLRFACIGDDGWLEYVWSTEIYDALTVSAGINNGDEIVGEYADILEQWRSELIALGGVTDEEIAGAVADYMEANPVQAGLTYAEKKIILEVFKGIAFNANMSAKVAELEALWSVSYKVTYNLTGAASSNNAASVAEGGTYTTTLTAEKLHTLKGAEVSVAMGGVDITSTAYSNGVITIESVTGAVVITVVAAEIVIADTTAVVETTGYGINRLGANVAAANVGITKAYDCPGAEYQLFAHIRIGDDVTYSNTYCRAVTFDTSGAVLNYSSEGPQKEVYLSSEAEAVALFIVPANAATLKMAVGVNHLEYSYAYWKNTGAVLFAGKNTPYYGMTNIDGTMA